MEVAQRTWQQPLSSPTRLGVLMILLPLSRSSRMPLVLESGDTWCLPSYFLFGHVTAMFLMAARMASGNLHVILHEKEMARECSDLP